MAAILHKSQNGCQKLKFSNTIIKYPFQITLIFFIFFILSQHIINNNWRNKTELNNNNKMDSRNYKWRHKWYTQIIHDGTQNENVTVWLNID